MSGTLKTLMRAYDPAPSGIRPHHLVQFLGKRSKELAGQRSDGKSQSPETVRIDATEAAPDPEPKPTAARLKAVNG
ncbi:hypothetical protein [Roseinatronobacter sp.]|uniref:hypothetical protein n=1 Tax=Roseinatronobacter sp. TaxID=1945755 RepID=UPI003F71C843